MGNVPAGEYYVKELVAPAGYELDTETHVVTVKAAETTRVDLRDVPSKGNADIVKRSDAPDKTDGNPNYSLAGIKYFAYTDEACSSPAGWVLTLDANGHAYQGNIALGTYWLKEDPASVKGKPFEVDKTAHRVDIKANATSYLKVTDHALFGSAEDRGAHARARRDLPRHRGAKGQRLGGELGRRVSLDRVASRVALRSARDRRCQARRRLRHQPRPRARDMLLRDFPKRTHGRLRDSHIL